MILSDVIALLRQAAPEDMAQDWDNPGLLVGDLSADVGKIFIALDADDAAIDQARDCGAGLLLTHHPLIFSPIKKVTADDFIGGRIVRMLRCGIAHYAMHTNFDAALMGTLAAGRIGLTAERPLADIFERDGRQYGIGVVGTMQGPMDAAGLCALVKERFCLREVRLFGRPDAPAGRVAICPGSGKSTIGDALSAGADVLLTGDIDHHSGIDAAARGLSVIDAGHYGLEHIFIDYMREYCERHIQGVGAVAQDMREPFEII